MLAGKTIKHWTEYHCILDRNIVLGGFENRKGRVDMQIGANVKSYLGN